ncbi:hypothetical protein F5Y16DRAFT_197598 [Xylariaceae sp. FL0255]|nr:hypothetical protein F5Y16DRAFT_197598 [Xylariaceae sp. FL0255]
MTKHATRAQRICNRTLHTLTSYPRMIVQHKAFPPFIHPMATSSGVENAHLEPLANCLSLVHIPTSRGT